MTSSTKSTSYVWVAQLLPLRFDEIEDPISGPRQRSPADKQGDEHDIREECRKVGDLMEIQC